ncbi:hypothetical protein [Sphingobacterium sp. LRF_L2]|uniref:hypothetical protein n=1 Tax=Sphingobacterium sp. LRF_L2 TaxID=3369421 RepID=UPI003F5E15B1
MKSKSFFLYFLIPFFLLSCSGNKDAEVEETSEYYFRYKLNGTQKDYSSFVNTASASFWNYIDFSVNGKQLSRISATQNIAYNGQRETLSIDLTSTEQIQSGVIYGSSAEVGVVVESFVFGLFDANGEMWLANNYNLSSQDVAVLNLSEIKDSSLKGTFSGVLYKNGNETETLVITDGEFFVYRAKL